MAKACLIIRGTHSKSAVTRETQYKYDLQLSLTGLPTKASACKQGAFAFFLQHCYSAQSSAVYLAVAD